MVPTAQTGILKIANENYYMASQREEQHSIMNFAVAFLNLLTLYMLWRAQLAPSVGVAVGRR